MKRGSKRQAEGDGPTASSRRRLRDGDEEAELQRLKEEEESARRKQKIQKAQEDGDDEDGWVDADDEEDEEDDEGYMDAGDYIQGNEAEEEEEIIDDGDEEDEDYADFQRETAAITSGMRRVTFSDEALAAADAASNEGGDGDAAPSIWRSDMQEKGHGSEQLAYANKAYDSFFQLRTEYPCLSFDVMRDATATMRYPLALTLVCGSQAEDPAKNKLYVLRVSNICRTKHDVDSDGDSEESYIGDEGDSEGDEDDEGEEEVNNGEPIVHHRTISHYGAANRVRCSPHNTSLVAVWSDAGHVQVFDLSSDVAALCDTARWLCEQARPTGQPRAAAAPLLFCTPSTAHRAEGYGLGWSPVEAGAFASGDCAGGLFVWRPGDAGRWRAAASSTPSEGEAAASVEEIQWSPTQADVLIAARAGGTVEVWDTRDMRSSKISWRADPTDINVADWNRARQASHLLATGAESGAAAVWDLRRVAEAAPIQRLSWHRGSITSVEFSPHNESVLALTGDDGQCTLWDLSLERDPGEEEGVIGELFGRPDLTGIPDQLMFQHQGLEHPKEAHWHAQIPGMVVTTDYLGLHLFRPMNWRSLMK